MSRAHTNPVLDTRMYHVELVGGKVIELATNVIAELIYAQCDADGNEYLLLDLLLDHRKENETIFLTEQQISI